MGAFDGSAQMLTQEKLHKLFDYNPETGVLKWKSSRRGLPYGKGLEAGGLTGRGYRVVSIDGQRYQATHLIWLFVYGKFPSETVDHINRLPDDNRLSNLRLASQTEQNYNQALRRDNTSGMAGVCFEQSRANRHKAPWVARFWEEGKRIHLGCFWQKEDAIAARKRAEQQSNSSQFFREAF
jgi:hypothetical protein